MCIHLTKCQWPSAIAGHGEIRKQGTRRMAICSSVWADVHTSYKVSVAQMAYGLLFGEIDFKNTIGRAFHGGLPKKDTKTQNLTRLWPKARISTFSEWTVVSFH